ncbi:hypothetical protein K435DRAFT_804499 [Dendrothele bispora CBS 962.96]|uniref:Uncharacterized protein n=1 Tax=Dendrothele bispora (strain CBS 962.96) TaxID=1314807 RepID=A0A4S8LEU0_DENBC|nr:hypothetical protein K435DRAFT_804499 [Dendrothele bispora CBS 962.96]
MTENDYDHAEDDHSTSFDIPGSNSTLASIPLHCLLLAPLVKATFHIKDTKLSNMVDITLVLQFTTQVSRFLNDDLRLIILFNDEDFETKIYEMSKEIDWKSRKQEARAKRISSNCEAALPRPSNSPPLSISLELLEGQEFFHPTLWHVETLPSAKPQRLGQTYPYAEVYYRFHRMYSLSQIKQNIESATD